MLPDAAAAGASTELSTGRGLPTGVRQLTVLPQFPDAIMTRLAIAALCLALAPLSGFAACPALLDVKLNSLEVSATMLSNCKRTFSLTVSLV